jgi:hypothetical protein
MHFRQCGVELIHALVVGRESIASMRRHGWCWTDMLATISAPVCWGWRWGSTRAWWRSKMVWLRQFVGHLSRIVLSMGVDMGILVSVVVRPVALGIIASAHGIVYLESVIWNGLGNRRSITITVHIRTVSIALRPREMLWWCAVLDVLQRRLVGNVAWGLISTGWRLDVLRKCCL